MEFGRGSTGVHSMENSFRNRLCTYHKTRLLDDDDDGGGGGDDGDDDDDMLFCVE
jgi:hypothetical protein